MANLSIRKLDDSIYERLRLLATEHAISMEEEVHRILSQAVAAPTQVSKVFQQCFGKENGIDLTELNQRKPPDPMDFT